MKKLISGMLLLSSVANAAFVPATLTKQTQAAQLMDVRARTAAEIQARAAAGFHFVSVDMDGATWKTERAIMKELQALGYTVSFENDHHVYGLNALNGGLLIKW